MWDWRLLFELRYKPPPRRQQHPPSPPAPSNPQGRSCPHGQFPYGNKRRATPTGRDAPQRPCEDCCRTKAILTRSLRSEEHTSELQSHLNLVCRLLLEKKKKI